MNRPRQPRSSKAQSTGSTEQPAGGLKAPILVVEDDPDLREILQIILENEDWATELAANGRQALDRVRSHAPQLVLLDLNLPDLSGEEVVARLRSEGQDKIPIVVVTADTWGAERASQLGAKYLAKPFHLDSLLASVHRALQTS